MKVFVVVSRPQLVGVEFASVKDDALHQALKNRQLHLDVVDRPGAIDRLTSRIESLSSLKSWRLYGFSRVTSTIGDFGSMIALAN